MTEACCEARLDLTEPDERDETADWTEPGRRSMLEFMTRPSGEREADEGGDADERDELAETTDMVTNAEQLERRRLAARHRPQCHRHASQAKGDAAFERAADTGARRLADLDRAPAGDRF